MCAGDGGASDADPTLSTTATTGCSTAPAQRGPLHIGVLSLLHDSRFSWYLVRRLARTRTTTHAPTSAKHAAAAAEVDVMTGTFCERWARAGAARKHDERR